MRHLNRWLPLAVLIICIILATGCVVSKSTYETLQNDYGTLQQEKTLLEADLQKANSRADNLQSGLDRIRAVFPSEYFGNYNGLDAWVKSHVKLAEGDDILEKHLDLQRMALADGYMWSVQYDWKTNVVGSCVIAGDSIYGVWLDGYIEWWGWR